MNVYKASRAAAATLCLFLGAAAPSYGLEKEQTTTDKVNIAKQANKPSRTRVGAIEQLALITDAAEIRDKHIIEELLALASGKDSDMFVRIASIDALGEIQVNYPLAKDKFIDTFITLIKGPTEHFLIRNAVASAFKKVLSKGLKDKDAYQVCVTIAKSRTEVTGLRASCISAIGIFPADDALDVLVPMLSDPEAIIIERTASAVYESLNRMGDKELPLPAINKLVDLLDSKTVGADLKVNVMKVLAQIIREGKTKAADPAFPKIVGYVKNEPDDKLVRGGIESLGIIASAAAVEPLKQAYADFKPAAAAPAADKEKDDATVAVAAKKKENVKETEIRQAIMDALGMILNTQSEKKLGFDAKAAHESGLLLCKAGEDDPSATVQHAAVFNLQYLYSPKFKAEWKEAVDMLTFKLRDSKTTDDMRVVVIKTLQAITGQDFGLDAARWDKWYQDNLGKKTR